MNFIFPKIELNTYFDIKFKILLLLLLFILLLINKTKRIIKRFLLINYFIICFINWSTYFFKLQGIDILVSKYSTDISYYDFNNINILNIIYLFFFELLYYIWSFITYQNNLSNWSLSYPKRVDIVPISKITIFYLGVLIYCLIFKRIS